MEIENNPDETGLDDTAVEAAAERPTLRQLLREFLSVLYSGIGIAFRRWIFLEDEIDLAVWQRFWVTVFGAVLINRICYYIGAVILRAAFFPLEMTSQGSSLYVYGLGRDIYITFLSTAPLVFCAVYLSHQWAIRHNSYVDIVQHAQIIAIVVFFRSVINGLLTIVSSSMLRPRYGTLFSLSGYEQLVLPGLEALSSIIGIVVLILGFGVLVYSYFIMARGMAFLHGDLEDEQAWTIVKIVFLVLEVPRIVLVLYSTIPLILSFFGIYFTYGY